MITSLKEGQLGIQNQDEEVRGATVAVHLVFLRLIDHGECEEMLYTASV